MSSFQSRQPSEFRFSPRHPDAYPSSSHTVKVPWHLSLHICLLIALVVVKLVSLWWWLFNGTKGQSRANCCSPDKPSCALNAVQSSSWTPKVRLVWEASGGLFCTGKVQGHAPCHGGRLRLELDFKEMQTRESTHAKTTSETTPHPRPVPETSSAPASISASRSVRQSCKSDVKSLPLRFGVAPRLVPVQELDGDNVLMPCSKDQPERYARLHGGMDPRRTVDTNANPDADADADMDKDRVLETKSYCTTPEIDTDTNTNTNENPGQKVDEDIDAVIHNHHDNHAHHMTSYLQLEDHIEEVIREFDELQRHRTGSLLREALTHNERARLIALYTRLERRLEEHMRGLGMEVDGSGVQLEGHEHGNQAQHEPADAVLRLAHWLARAT
ncbi:hypothetical protein G647_02865 [Cladophialophora carrionii CBS 160.54]|uniref:Uncharacterized protein n=1 Tax=Cladophialophora carrionii CBS 160.54 TaxID=1279043 RepID=V9DIE2_9EURO|nr:uncharacterized protein G647_02865 [Cladophialophora carrionii CBS 160.54]ETI26088.1 hypothetical protein G647_02865 [Cladophialophora carrionii CBS 160.54]